jgi:hypothetical protein
MREDSALQLKKKTAIVAAVAIGSVAVGGAAWAYVTATGGGAASATVNAETATVSLSGSATIIDLDDPVSVKINGTSSLANRHINGVRVTINPAATLPAACNRDWFKVSSNGVDYASTADTATPFTFVDTNPKPDFIPDVVKVKLVNDPNADQTACLAQSPSNLLTLLAI